MTASTTNETTSPGSDSTSGDDATEPGEAYLSAWTREGEGNEFTPEEVIALLEKHGSVWGVPYADFGDFVQAIPQNKKRKRPGSPVVDTVPAWTLYMSVAGRLAMLNAAAEINGWNVELYPVSGTPTGIDGVLSMEDAIIYRVVCEISRWDHGQERYIVVGRRFGQAWVPSASDRANAAKSNPWEKVETAAHGRAIAAWGIGILPGSGVASAEEIQAVNAAERAAERQASRGPGGAVQGNTVREKREDLLAECQALTEQLRSVVGVEQDAAIEANARWLAKNYALTDLIDPQTGGLAWAKVKDGQLLQMRGWLRTNLQKVLAAGGSS